MQPAVVHIHIPKCAGTTMGIWLSQNVADHHTLFLEDAEQVEAFRKMDIRERTGQFRVAVGMTYFGALDEMFDQPCRHVVVFREPRERLVSYYNYVCRAEGHFLHRRFHEEKLSLRDYLTWLPDEDRDLAISIRNYYLYALTGRTFREDDPSWNSACLEKALTNLSDERLVCGTVERLEASIQLFAKSLGVGCKGAMHLNAAPAVQKVGSLDIRSPDNLSPEEDELLREATKFDQVIYDKALDRFESMVST